MPDICEHLNWSGTLATGPSCAACGARSDDDSPPIATNMLTDIEGILADGFRESLRRAEIERISYDLRAKKQARGEIF